MIPGYLSGALRDIPEPAGYRYRARTYPWADRLLAAAEREHGQPWPTCLGCGGHVTYSRRHGQPVNGQCIECGRSPVRDSQVPA